MRNRLTHGYDAMDTIFVWDAVQTKLPVLQARQADRLTQNEGQ